MKKFSRNLQIGVIDNTKYTQHKNHKNSVSYTMNIYTDGRWEAEISFNNVKGVGESNNSLVVMFEDGSILTFDLQDIEYYNLNVDTATYTTIW